jgi:hypothetical protein
MRAGKPGILACLGIAATGVAALATACSAPSSLSLAAGQSPAGRATPTMTPSPVAVLGQLSFGTFPATQDGERALMLCEDWAGLRGEYVGRILAQTPYQLEQWFSSAAWRPAFSADSPLKTDPAYSKITTAFSLATAGQAASIANARSLDRACAAAD